MDIAKIISIGIITASASASGASATSPGLSRELMKKSPAVTAVASKATPSATYGQQRPTIQTLAESEPPAHKATRDDILGNYVYDEFRYANAHTGWDYTYCVPEIVAGEGDDEVVLLGFWADYDTSTYPPTPISRVKATFDPSAQTITIPAGASLGKYGDYDAYIYVSDWATDILQPDPIVLKVDAATRCISYYCDRTDNDWMKPQNCLIVTSYPDAVGQHIDKGADFIGAIVMNKFNAVMGVNGESLTSTAYVPIYTETEGSDFTVHNFGGYGYDFGVTFTADAATATCSAPATPLATKAYGNDVCIASPEGEALSGHLTQSADGSKYSVTIGPWALYDAEAGKPLAEFTEAFLDIALPLAGVGTIGSDTSSTPGHAPVYYDINGHRHDTPQRGAINIMVKDGRTTKIMVR